MTTSSNEDTLPPGTELVGKWNGKTYRLDRLLGSGANGQVYLASFGPLAVALKLGGDPADLQGEANILAALDKRHKDRRRAFLLDVDDATAAGVDRPFYVMRYVKGSPLDVYMRDQGSHWFGVIGSRLLERLGRLHGAGWIFGDLKIDNVLVGEYGRVELVDFGGVSEIGRSVRQFTEIYDRGYWHAGSRSAEPGYDLFAAAILWLHALDGKRLLVLTRTVLPQNRNVGELMKLVRSHPRLATAESWMEKALHGKFADTAEAVEEWGQYVRRSGSPTRKERVPLWMAGMLAGSIVLCASLAAFWLLN